MPVSPRSHWSAKRLADGDARAKGVIQFIEQCCVHTIGKWAGLPFVLAPWQREFVYEVFSNVDKHGLRITRRAFLQIARKQGKSELAAAVALYLLCADGEESPQVYGAAEDRDQASIVFDVAMQMASRSEELRNVLKPLKGTHRILCPENGGFYRTIPADAGGAFGFNASGIIFDEFHTQKKRDLYDALSTSTSARDQPLIFMITTAGFDKTNGPCYEVYDYAKKVASGYIKDDPSFVGRVFELPPGTSFEQVAERDAKGNFVREGDLWTMANPSLIGQPGGFVNPAEIRRAVTEAVHLPRARNHVLNLHFNIWTDTEETWLNMPQWDKCGGLVNESDLKGQPFFGGLDISHTQDFTAWGKFFPEEREDGEIAGQYSLHLWIPEASIVKHGTYADSIDEWARAGYVTICPGEVVDHRDVLATIHRDLKDFTCTELAYDNFHAYPIVSELIEDLGEQMVDAGQTYRHMNAPCKLLEQMLAQKRLNHGGNPVLRWMAANAVAEVNQDDLIRPSRKKSADKIDGLVALLMCLNRALAYQDEGFSMYIPGEESA
jgi:phage terminase large subunit-like protein